MDVVEVKQVAPAIPTGDAGLPPVDATSGAGTVISPRASRRLRTGLPGQRRVTRRSSIPLFAVGAAESYRSRWTDIQTSFVDEPGGSVEQADLLVAEVMKQLAETFAEKRAKLELKLVKGEELSTEDLRVALRRYRSFFDRLLSI
jgi:hypothetical protein